MSLLFFDIDGTISDERTFTIPESTKNALIDAKKNGHQIFVNSGRTFCSIDKSIRELGFDGYVCGCGTSIIYHDELVFYRDINEELRQEIVNMSIDSGVENVLEGIKGIYFPEYQYSKAVSFIYDHYVNKGYPVYTYNKTSVPEFEKMALWYEHGDVDVFKEAFKDELQYIQRDKYFIENVPIGFSKATGIDKVCELLGVSINDTYGFGDSMNDLDMLKHVHTSICMGNGHKDLKEIVSYVTDDVLENGLANAMYHFGLIDTVRID